MTDVDAEAIAARADEVRDGNREGDINLANNVTLVPAPNATEAVVPAQATESARATGVFQEGSATLGAASTNATTVPPAAVVAAPTNHDPQPQPARVHNRAANNANRTRREQQIQLANRAVGAGQNGQAGETQARRTRRNPDQVDVLDQMSSFYGQQIRNTSRLIAELNSQQVVSKLQATITSAIEIRAQKQRNGIDCTRDDAIIDAMQRKLEEELNAQFGIQL